MSNPSAKREINEWWKEVIDEALAQSAEVDMNELARRGVKELGDTPGFHERFFLAFAQGTFYEVGRQVVSKRKQAFRSPVVVREQVKTDAKAVKVDWSRWLEFEPDTGFSIPFIDLTYEQLEVAEQRRLQQAAPMLQDARFFKAVRSGMRPGQHVGDVYDEAKLNDIRQTIYVKVRPIRKAA